MNKLIGQEENGTGKNGTRKDEPRKDGTKIRQKKQRDSHGFDKTGEKTIDLGNVI